jgi:effector-binding domain-containing protein
MLESPHITDVPERLAAVISLTVPASEIRNVMGPAIGEVMATVAAQGIVPAGPWFTYHHRVPTDTFDFEVGVPVASEVKPAGRVRPGRLPAATVARAVYVGPYEGLGAGWGEFVAWIAAQGRVPAGNLWECYAVGPESGPDPSKWRTELYRPLRT